LHAAPARTRTSIALVVFDPREADLLSRLIELEGLDSCMHGSIDPCNDKIKTTRRSSFLALVQVRMYREVVVVGIWNRSNRSFLPHISRRALNYGRLKKGMNEQVSGVQLIDRKPMS
jgi:hypothetical protein